MGDTPGDCSWYDAGCKGKSAAAEWFNEQIAELATQLVAGTANLSASIASAWVSIPLMPTLGTWSGGGVCEPDPANPGRVICDNPEWSDSDILVWFNQTHILGWWVAAFAVMGLMSVGIRMMLSQNGADAREAVKGLIVFALVAGGGTALVQTLLASGDQFSEYLLQQAVLKPDEEPPTGGYEETFGDGLAQVMFLPADLTDSAIGESFWMSSAAGGLIVSILLLLFSLLVFVVQLVILVIRGGLLVVMVVLLPAAAALVMTQKGKEMFGRYAGWMLALILYKPAAAVLYAVAFRLGSGEENLLNVITGIAIFVLSLFMLPALLRLIVPATAAVAGGGGTGGLAAAGAGAMAGAGAAMLGGSASGAVAAKSMMGASGAGPTSGNAAGGPSGATGAVGGGPSGRGGSDGGGFAPSGAENGAAPAAGAFSPSSSGDAAPGGASGSESASSSRPPEDSGGSHGSAAGAGGGATAQEVGGGDRTADAAGVGGSRDGASGSGVVSTGPAGADGHAGAAGERGSDGLDAAEGPGSDEAPSGAARRAATGARFGSQIGQTASAGRDAVLSDDEGQEGGPSGSKQ